MQADRNDRNDRIDGDGTGGRTGGRHSAQTLLISIAVIILAAGAYLLKPKDDAPAPAIEEVSQEPVIEAPTPVIAPTVEAAPDIPETVQAPEPTLESETTPEPEPPTQEELDDAFREALSDAGVNLAPLIASANSAPFLLDRSVSALDQVARGFVPYRALNIARPTGKFDVERSGNNYLVGSQSYQRYNPIVSAVTAIPTAAVARFFHRFRPQLSSAYATLGYPADDLDNTLIAALDVIRTAPVLEEPPLLISKGALWAYADKNLEGANDVHKQLLRTGPENTRSLQVWATQLRQELLAGSND